MKALSTYVGDVEYNRDFYIEIDGIRIIYDGGIIIGWYRP